MMLIGLSGKIGSGKDTVADIFCKINNTFEKKAFAYKLKYITHYLTGCSLNDCYTQEGKNKILPEWNMTIGEFQQKLGTEAIRNGIHSNGWIISLFANFKSNLNWIITDVRFKNEAQAIKERNGVLIRIEGDPANVRKNSKRDMNHPSEIELDSWTNWDYIIINNLTLEELKNNVENIYYDMRLFNK